MAVSKKQPYPSQLGPYAIRIKEGDEWRSYDTLRLEISIGQNYHEGQKFLCTTDWAKSRFKNVVVLCNDTLQRYNLALIHGGEPDDYLHKTFREGSEWIRRNWSALSGIRIARWEDWRSASDFATASENSWSLYRENLTFQNAVLDSIRAVYERRLLRGAVSENDKDRFFRLSLDYLMEETAGLALAYRDYHGISAYPGTFLEMWRMFVDQPIHGPLAGLSNAHCIRIDFDRRNCG